MPPISRSAASMKEAARSNGISMRLATLISRLVGYPKPVIREQPVMADMRPRCRPPAHLMDPGIVAAFNASEAKCR